MVRNCEEKDLIDELITENNRLTVENRKVTRENYWLNYENTQWREEFEKRK